jgi:peptidyl-dipeptidase A
LCNLRSNSHWMGTLLHELGHAVYDKYVNRELPFVLSGPPHTLSTEAIAILMEQFLQSGAWLVKYAGVEQSEATKLESALYRQRAAKQVIFVRWGLVMVYFERELYRNPDQDLNKLWWEIVSRLQLLHKPDSRNEPDWAAKIHIACAPVYYQNYILGYMMAEHLADHMKTNILKSNELGLNILVGKKAVGTYLKEKVFYPGSVKAWNEALEVATGRKLDSSPMVFNILNGIK